MKSVIRHVSLFLLSFFIIGYTSGQIYQPEGINMPGSWDSWTNPPTIDALKSAGQGGEIEKIELGTDVYQAEFSVPGDLPAGSHEFKFSSGPSTNYWANVWGDGSFSVNIVGNTIHGAGPNNTITLSSDKFYVVNYEDNGYGDTRALFMELSSAPVHITGIEQSPVLPESNEDVTISITTDAEPAAGEYFYLRYSTDGWTSYQLAEFAFTGTQGTAVIPGEASSTTVEYYAFSTNAQNPSDDFDIKTIRVKNNSGDNYSYTVGQAVSCTASDYNVVSTTPAFPQDESSITISFNAALGNQGLMGYTDDVYAHIGVITSNSTSGTDWKYVKTDWGENTPDTKFTNVGTDLYELQIDNIRTYFGVPANEDILQIAMLARSGEPVDIEEPDNFYLGKNADGSDMFLDIYPLELNVKFIAPTATQTLFSPNDVIPVCVEAFEASTLELYIDGDLITGESTLSLSYPLAASSYTAGLHTLKAVASNAKSTVEVETPIFIRGDVVTAPLPDGIDKPGIHYISDTEATLVLHDPPALKDYVFVLGDFNDWKPTEEGYMKQTADGQFFWTTITGLTPGEEYAYQYFIDNELRLADPYTEKILDPWNDKWIDSYNYPNILPYPEGQTTGIVSVLQPGKTEYNWQYSDNFVPAAQGSTHKNLIIYELHIRDFVESRAIKDVTAKLDYLETLGINAIELMPINEFEGNDSWGYNPSFYFAPDKAYGTEEDYKEFIDECHKRGIAVIIDMVLNHSFQMSPFVQMYFDPDAGEWGQPMPENPWYNVESPNATWSWGYDFDHESTYTRELVKRITKFWIDEYKIDGYRFDFTKGFTNTPGDGWNYDQSRIDILNDYNGHINWAYDNGSGRYPYVILEHLTDNSEESALAASGMMLWTGAELNHIYSQNTMGYNADSDFSSAYYENRGWANANLVQYMESHDEERIMYRNLNFGDYTQDLATAIKHNKAVVPFFMLIPGPKMLWQFQELGYDISIDEPCRVCPKPIHWEYYDEPDRYELFNTFSSLAELIEESEIFVGGNTSFSMDVGSDGHDKRMWLSNGTVNMVLAANISGNLSFNITPGFQHTGTWYDFFSGESINVTDNAGHQVWFEPGDMHLWINQDFHHLVSNETAQAELDFSLYPNIVSGGQQVKLTVPESGNITAINLLGKEIRSKNIEAGRSYINTSDLQPGIYLIRFENGSSSASKKLIVK